MLFYVFILDVNFLAIKATSNINTMESLNISNKIFIISSLIFFYMLPFILNKVSIKFIFEEFKFNYFYFIIIIFFLLIYFFNYSNEYTGGGIFFKFSNEILGNSYLFFLIVFISFLLIVNFLK